MQSWIWASLMNGLGLQIAKQSGDTRATTVQGDNNTQRCGQSQRQHHSFNRKADGVDTVFEYPQEQPK